MKSWVRRAVLALVVITVMAGAGFAWLYEQMQRALDAPLTLDAPELFEVTSGQSSAGLADALATRGWLANPLFFRIEARRRGVAARIQAGTYEITSGLTPRALLEKFVRGDVKRYAYTIVEGTTFRTLREQLAGLPGVRVTLSGLDDAAVMAALDKPGENPEGRFFPSTYFYHHHTPDLELLRRAYREMERLLAEAWLARGPDLPYRSPYEALIMASIIEKETGRADERPAISGVFVRRLRRGMKLQTDPTVIYGLGAAFDGNLRRVDLQRDTPYNTYTRPGLPPTPIAMPGHASLRAALDPAPGDALYFVARGDGSHEFSVTLADHQRAVRKYQLGQR